MDRSGRQLEALVALIEKLYLPDGFEIKTNKNIFKDGVQIAEFDIEINGRLGTTEIRWLIECRDRPSDGRAPSSWIEQLVGRRERFAFNKVTAVSTTGFAQDALDFAKSKGIETREVRALAPQHFADWLQLRTLTQIESYCSLDDISVLIDESESRDRKEAFQTAIGGKRFGDKFLRWVATNEIWSGDEAFRSELSNKRELYKDVVPNQDGKPIVLKVSYPDESGHFVVDTDVGPVRVRQIHFSGKISIKQTELPLIHTTEYSDADSGKSISQSAAFEFEALNTRLSLEMHKLTGSTGETQVLLRKIEPPKAAN